MSGAPPGYNPNESMLSGGNSTPILKVMGGGGMSPPPDYNASESMLKGGDAPIIKVMGGGQREPVGPKVKQEVIRVPPPPLPPSAGKPAAAPAAKEEEFDNLGFSAFPLKLDDAAAVPAPVPAPIFAGFQVEVYDPLIPEEDDLSITALMNEVTEKISITKTWTSHLFTLSQSFKNSYEKKWQRIGADEKLEPGSVPRLSQCSEESHPARHKMVHTIKNTTKNIIVIPPVSGNIRFFLRTLNFLYNNNCFETIEDDFLKLRDNYTLVCLAPFYDPKNDSPQSELLFLFLRIWYANHDNFFVLQENDDSAWSTGCSLYAGIPSEATLRKDYLLNMLNPSYLVMQTPDSKHKGIVFSSGITGQTPFIPSSKNAKFLSASAALPKFTSLSINSGIQADKPFTEYLTFLSEGVPDSLPAPQLDIPICNSLRTIFYDEDVTKKIYKINDNSVYVFRIGEKRVPPLFCMDVTGKSRLLLPRPGAFQGSENNPKYEKGSGTKSIFFQGETIHIRIPSNENRVKENWMDEIFSNEEARFLTLLNVTPMMLAKIFDKDWKKNLADFLELVTVSDCFSDVILLTKGECQEAYYFLEKIREWLFLNTVIELDDDPFEQLALSGQLRRGAIPPISRPTLASGAEDSSSSLQITEIPWPAEPYLRKITKEDFKDNKGKISSIFDTIKKEWFVDVKVQPKNSSAIAYYRILIPNNVLYQLIRESNLQAQKQKLNLNEMFASLLTTYQDKYSNFNWIL